MEFSIGTGIYILLSNLNLNIRKTAGHKNEILIGNIDMKINTNRNINNADVYHHKAAQTRLPAPPC